MGVIVLTGTTPDSWAAERFKSAEWAELGLTVCSEKVADQVDARTNILVIAPSVPDPLVRARQFRQRHPAGRVVFVVPPERLDRMRGILPFSPEISEASVVDAVVPEQELMRLVREATKALENRTAIRGMYNRINAHFAEATRPVDDVSARRTRHLALAERYLQAILTNAPDALFAAALDGAVVSWNDAAARLFARSWDDVSGRNFADLFRPEDRGQAVSVLTSAAMGDRVPTRELRITDRTGSELTLEIGAAPVLGEGGAIEGVSLVARDVTARKRDEAALRRLNDDLEGRIVEAIAEREQAATALRQAQKMEAVGQLTGGVAHDFNNLLTVIKSSIEFLRRPDLPDARRNRYVDAIADTVDRAAKLTGQLLAFARRQPLKPETFDAAERVRSVVDLLGSIVGARIRIEADIPDQPCFVNADASQFDTALVNIAVNARDAMDGEGTLRFGLHTVEGIPAIRGHVHAPGPFIAVTVSDTGAGIPTDKLGLIFEPFFTTKEVGKGTGLGLSQVFGFAKQSGGDVAVESKIGQGARFTLYLPRIDQAEEPSRLVPDASVPERAERRRVLLVEDNVEVGRFAAQMLEDIGHTITWAPNAADALRYLEEDSERFDIVFSDVVMPGMNGVDLGLTIRRCYPGLPVVLASGYSHVLAEEGRHGFELVQKPYAAGEVSRMLNRLARKTRVSGR